ALLAEGRSQAEVARMTGYSLWHVNRLANHDPGFMTEGDRGAENFRDEAQMAFAQTLQRLNEVLGTGETRDGLIAVGRRGDGLFTPGVEGRWSGVEAPIAPGGMRERRPLLALLGALAHRSRRQRRARLTLKAPVF